MRTAIRRAIAAALPLIAAIITVQTVTADPVIAGEEHCVVNVARDDVLNVREGPGTRFPIVADERYGECGIIVLQPCRGNWCLVEDGHHRGWVHRHFVAAVSPARYCVTGVAPGDVLNLRAWPSPRSRVIHRIGRQACGIAFLPYARGSWQKVRVAGWKGWVNRRYLSGE